MIVECRKAAPPGEGEQCGNAQPNVQIAWCRRDAFTSKDKDDENWNHLHSYTDFLP
jgi:hypothetical protein